MGQENISKNTTEKVKLPEIAARNQKTQPKGNPPPKRGGEKPGQTNRLVNTQRKDLKTEDVSRKCSIDKGGKPRKKIQGPTPDQIREQKRRRNPLIVQRTRERKKPGIKTNQ